MLPNWRAELRCRVSDIGPLSAARYALLKGLTSVIRATDTEAQRRAVGSLINNRYAWRGYGSGFTVEERPGQMTLFATDYPRACPSAR